MEEIKQNVADLECNILQVKEELTNKVMRAHARMHTHTHTHTHSCTHTHAHTHTVYIFTSEFPPTIHLMCLPLKSCISVHVSGSEDYYISLTCPLQCVSSPLFLSTAYTATLTAAG